MKNKSKISLLSLVSAITLLSLPSVTATLVFSNGFLYEETYLAGMKLKRDLLKKKENHRIIFIGGSALTFGLRSYLIEQELPQYHVVNFGLYGALGSECMLDLALPYIQEGDVVVLSFEQNQQTLSQYFSGMNMWQAIDDCKDAIFDLDERDQKALFGSSMAFAQQKFGYLTAGERPHGDGAYAYANFNAYGDIDCEIPSGNALSRRYDPNQMIRFDAKWWEEGFINDVNYFVSKASERRAKTYYWLAPANEKSVQNIGELDTYYDFLDCSLNCDILGDPADSIIDSGYFYDSNFHLNNAGAVNNSRRFVLDMKAELGDPSKTGIAIQEIPEAIVPESYEGDDSDAAFFEYDIEGNTAYVTSLSTSGRDKTSLIVPSTYQGLMVTRFDATTFQNNSDIQKVVLQQNISEIADYSFSGASKLTYIELRNPNPSSVNIGAHLLDGTSADIYVPAEALWTYRSHYFFSQYAQRIKAIS